MDRGSRDGLRVQEGEIAGVDVDADGGGAPMACFVGTKDAGSMLLFLPERHGNEDEDRSGIRVCLPHELTRVP